VRRSDLVKRAEEVALQIKLLGRGLDHAVDLGAGRGQLIERGDVCEHRVASGLL